MGYRRDLCLKRSVFPILVVFFLIFQVFLEPMLHRILADPAHGCKNAWPEGTKFDLKLLLTNHSELEQRAEDIVLAYLKEIPYINPKLFTGETLLDMIFAVNLTHEVKTNISTLYLQVRGSQSVCGFDDNVTDGTKCFQIVTSQPIIRWDVGSIDLGHNLGHENQSNLPNSAFVFGNMSFDVVFDDDTESRDTLYAHNGPFFRFIDSHHVYLPPLSYDKFWDLEAYKRRINLDNEHSLKINVKIHLRRKWLWETKLEWDQTDDGTYIQKQWDDLKTAISDKPPLLLWLTVIISISHFVLQILAFREDIIWWNSREVLIAVSLHSLIIGAINRFVVFLFLMDEDTSTLVCFLYGTSMLIEFWKVSRLLQPIPIYPWLKLKDRYKTSTMAADQEASKYLMYIMLPVITMYSLYSLFFKQFKSLYYSFALRVAVGLVYSFGFCQMLPQLYINYKLKTVAGMSTPVLAFKLLNTFIDDLFAWIMNMPTMHRIACLRDDIVFFVWLYQRHIYPTDPTRTNEFGETKEQ